MIHLRKSERKAGLAISRKRETRPPAARLNGGSTTVGPPVGPMETKGNVIEKESKALTNTDTSGLAFSSSNSVRPSAFLPASQGVYFNSALTNIIRPRSQSDRTCFRNVTNWLTKGCAEDTFTQEIFARVLDLAEEVKTGRKPAAVFMALLKKELGYKNE